MMNLYQDKTTKTENPFTAASPRAYWLVGLVGLIITGMMAYSFYAGNRIVTTYAPLVNAAMGIKLEATTAHLWLEETLSDDHHGEMEVVWYHMGQADWYAQAMLEGGTNLAGTFLPLDDPAMRQEIRDVQGHLAEFRGAAQQRVTAGEPSAAGADVDQDSDAVFLDFVAQADDVETRLRQIIARDLSRFRITQSLSLVSAFAIFLAAGIAYQRLDRRRATGFQAVREANERLQAEVARRAQVETDLRASRARYRNIFQTASVAIWEEDFSAIKATIDEVKAQGVTDFRAYLDARPEFVEQAAAMVKIVDVNDEALKMYGARSKEELLAALPQVFVPESLFVFREELIAIAEGKLRFEAEAVIQTLQGDRLDVMLKLNIPAEDAAFTNALVSLMDITERKQTEAIAERRRRELITLYEAAVAISSDLSLDTVLQTVASQMVRTLDSGECALSLWRREQDLVETLVDYSAVWPDETDSPGTTYDLNDYPATRRVLESRQPLFIQRADSTADEAELALMEREEVQTLLMLPLVTRDQVVGVVELFEKAEARDYAPEEIRLAQSLAAQAAIAIENARLYEQVQRYTAELEQSITERTAELQTRVAEVETLNRAITNLLEDVQAANRHATKTAQQLAETNAELESFAYSVSHDLRAPLRAIDGFSQALLEDYQNQLDDPGQNYLRRVRAASQRMGQLIDDLLTLSRITRREMAYREVNLSALASEALADLRQGSPQRAATIVITPDIVVEGDEGLLQAALVNLLDNAWKFCSKEPETRIEFGIMAGQEETVYFVRDNGAGFDMAYADKLFGPFQRLHSADEFPGTGIGLATVQRIIHRHGGRIWAEAAVGKGATFYFTL